MKRIFTPEDFGGYYENGYTSKFDAEGVAQIANAKLEKLIESWPVVYGAKYSDDRGLAFDERRLPESTHTARLAFIETIEPCKHREIVAIKGAEEGQCMKCGAELKLVAEWKAK
jgi:hypothetical protein